MPWDGVVSSQFFKLQAQVIRAFLFEEPFKCKLGFGASILAQICFLNELGQNLPKSAEKSGTTRCRSTDLPVATVSQESGDKLFGRWQHFLDLNDRFGMEKEDTVLTFECYEIRTDHDTNSAQLSQAGPTKFLFGYISTQRLPEGTDAGALIIYTAKDKCLELFDGK